MKPFFKIFTIAAIIVNTATSCYVSQTVAQQPNESYTQDEISFNTFYDELSPYGTWITNPEYGRVWVCREPGFKPYYSGGYWDYTSYGWTWVSDYDWGWAPFHYGRWASDPMYGWFWVPGYEWAPAWVGWRSGNGYYGWAPLSPGINISIGSSYNGMPLDSWSFLPNQYMGNPQMRNYYVNHSRNVLIINNTTIINNTNVYRNATFARGPERAEVERYSGRKITPLPIRDARNPHEARNNNGGLNLYRPSVKRDDNHDRQPGNNNQQNQQGRGNNDPNKQRPTTPPPSTNPTDGRNRMPVMPAKPADKPTPVNPRDHAEQRQTPPAVTPQNPTDGRNRMPVMPANPPDKQAPVNQQRDHAEQRQTPPAVSPQNPTDGRNRMPVMPANPPEKQAPVNQQREHHADQRPANDGHQFQNNRPVENTDRNVSPNNNRNAQTVKPGTQQQQQKPAPVKPQPAPQKPKQNPPPKPKEEPKKPDQ